MTLRRLFGKPFFCSVGMSVGCLVFGAFAEIIWFTALGQPIPTSGYPDSIGGWQTEAIMVSSVAGFLYGLVCDDGVVK